MAITFRHDAAAVALPSNQAQRKYGQSLVLQQQQQKYQAQQAGYDRFFDAYKQQTQNQFQLNRDAFQNEMDFRKEGRQNQFVLGRDKAQFEQQQQMAEAERQRAFMDEARKQSSAMIMDDIKNGEFDPATARKLQQNLVEEAEALGNPQLDPTQRAEALAKIRAERSVLSANRMQKPPPPSAQEQFDQGIVTRNGVEYRKNAKGDWVPLEQPKPEPQPQQPQRPTSADEAFQADPKIRKEYMDQAIQMEVGDNQLTPELRKKAMERARQLYEEDNNLGTPTTAPEMPGETAQNPPEMRSILEQQGQPTQAPAMPGAEPSSPTGMTSILEPAPQPTGPGADALIAQGYQWTVPADGGKPYWYNPGPSGKPATEPLSAGQPTPEPSPAQNDWAELAGQAPVPGSQATAPQSASQPTPASPAQSVELPKAPEPSFGKLFANATDDDDRALIGVLQQAWANAKTPEIQNAIGILANPNAQKADKLTAFEYLQASGFDVNQLQMAANTSSKEYSPGYAEASYSM